jgi:hypothetical protein
MTRYPGVGGREVRFHEITPSGPPIHLDGLSPCRTCAFGVPKRAIWEITKPPGVAPSHASPNGLPAPVVQNRALYEWRVIRPGADILELR